MTQIPQDMPDQQLNRELALLCGHEEITEREDVMIRRQRNDYEGNGVVVLYGDHYIVRANGKYGRWDPCTDPAASLEVQAAAMSKDDVTYIRNLVDITCGIESGIIADTMIGMRIIPKLLSATPRERAEAAWMTLRTDTASGEA